MTDLPQRLFIFLVGYTPNSSACPCVEISHANVRFLGWWWRDLVMFVLVMFGGSGGAAVEDVIRGRD